MSKGLGRTERKIISALEKLPAFYLTELQETQTAAEYQSLHRAACSLERKGLIAINRYQCGLNKTIIHMPWYSVDRLEFNRKRLAGQQSPPA
jgi:hypothetical protein